MSHHVPNYLLDGSVCAHHWPKELVCGNGQYLYVRAMCHDVYMTHGTHIQIHFNFNSGMVTSRPPCGTLNHFVLLQYFTLTAACRTERHCN